MIIADLCILVGLEIVLGADNICFLADIVRRVPEEHRERVRKAGLLLAMLARIALLLTFLWVLHFTTPLFIIGAYTLTLHNAILLVGGGFLVINSLIEFGKVWRGEEEERDEKDFDQRAMALVLLEIMVGDLALSLDSVITAVGISQNPIIMVAAIVASIFVMLFASKWVGEMLERYPTIQLPALAFLVLVGSGLFLSAINIMIPVAVIYGVGGGLFALEGLALVTGVHKGKVQGPDARTLRAADPDVPDGTDFDAQIVALAKARDQRREATANSGPSEGVEPPDPS